VLAITYVALGDSYTIGTGASHPDRAFPSLLLRRLGPGVRLRNLGVDGFTTDDLIRYELPELRAPQLVSILIGANDICQGLGAQGYRSNLRAIHAHVEKAVANPSHVLALTMPDFSVVPAAEDYGGAAHLAPLIHEFNAICLEEARDRGFMVADIAPLSRLAATERAWLSEDLLHPSDIQYAAWAAHIWDGVAGRWGTLAVSAGEED
jgi:lysophospholipase L1-like esterase